MATVYGHVCSVRAQSAVLSPRQHVRDMHVRAAAAACVQVSLRCVASPWCSSAVPLRVLR